MCLCVRAWSGYMSWQRVNSMSWIVSVGEGAIGVCVWFGAPITLKYLVVLWLGIGMLFVPMYI